MHFFTIVAVVAGGLTAIVFGVAGYFFGREFLRRYLTKRQIKRLARAREVLLQTAGKQAPASAVTLLQRLVDRDALAIVLEEALREETQREKIWLRETFDQLGLAEHYTRLVREGERWSERAHAAEVLGLVGAAGAVPALVASLRDPYEDVGTVKLAATRALAAIRSPEAVPLLVKELKQIDEWSSPRVAEALVAFGSLALAPLVVLLGEQEANSSVWAARILGRLKVREALEPLVECLQRQQDSVRVAAAEALGALGEKGAVRGLVQAALRDPVPQVRAHAAAAIGKIGDEASIDVLVAALSDPDYSTRLLALEALETIKPKNTKPIERALRDQSPDIRRRAALALERVGYLAQRVEELTSDDRETVFNATTAIKTLGRAGAIDSVAAFIHHPDFRVRAQIARLCADLGASHVGPLLLASIDDAEWPVRARLAETIGRLGLEGGVPALVQLLADPEAAVQEAAAESLAAYTPEQLVPAYESFQGAYERGSPVVRAAIVARLAVFDTKETEAMLVQATADPGQPVRLAALKALSQRRGSPPLECLVDRLSDASMDVRLAAVDALGSLEQIEATQVLLRALPGATPEVRDRIAQALARGLHGNKESLRGHMEHMAKAADLDVRLGIAWTLGKIGDADGVPFLATYLRAPEPRLRASAAGALGKIQFPAAIEALLGSVTDRDPRTRAAVVNALGRLSKGTKDRHVLESLRHALQDPDQFVRNRTALAVGLVGGDMAEGMLQNEALCRGLDRTARTIGLALTGTHSAIASAIADLSDRELLGRIRELLANEPPWIREDFFKHMRIGESGVDSEHGLEEATLLDRYHDLVRTSQDARLRHIALEALSKIRSDRSLETLADALATDPVEEIRMMAACALAGRLEQEIARLALARAAADPSPEVSIVAIRALGRTHDVRFSKELFDRLGDTSAPELSAASASALAEMHLSEPAPLIDLIMGSDRPEVVAAGVRVLGLMGSTKLLPLLRELILAKDRRVQVAAVQAVAGIPGSDAAAILDQAVRHTDETIRLAVLEAACEAADDHSLDRIGPLSTDPAISIRARLATILDRFGRRPARDQLLERLLGDVAPSVRGAALGSLLNLAEDESLRRFVGVWGHATAEDRSRLRQDSRRDGIAARLIQVLSRSPDPTARAAAVLGLSAFGAGDFRQPLLSAMRDPTPAVRLAAVAALAAVEDDTVRTSIVEMLDDPDQEVREAARKSHLRVVH